MIYRSKIYIAAHKGIAYRIEIYRLKTCGADEPPAYAYVG